MEKWKKLACPDIDDDFDLMGTIRVAGSDGKGIGGKIRKGQHFLLVYRYRKEWKISQYKHQNDWMFWNQFTIDSPVAQAFVEENGIDLKNRSAPSIKYDIEDKRNGMSASRRKRGAKNMRTR